MRAVPSSGQHRHENQHPCRDPACKFQLLHTPRARRAASASPTPAPPAPGSRPLTSPQAPAELHRLRAAPRGPCRGLRAAPPPSSSARRRRQDRHRHRHRLRDRQRGRARPAPLRSARPAPRRRPEAAPAAAAGRAAPGRGRCGARPPAACSSSPSCWGCRPACRCGCRPWAPRCAVLPVRAGGASPEAVIARNTEPPVLMCIQQDAGFEAHTLLLTVPFNSHACYPTLLCHLQLLPYTPSFMPPPTTGTKISKALLSRKQLCASGDVWQLFLRVNTPEE